jgi:general stress protein 26
MARSSRLLRFAHFRRTLGFNTEGADMSHLNLADIAKKMRDIDFAMLMTHTDEGNIAGRPMSNNQEVDYDGDSYYFTWSHARMVRDIERHPQVAVSFAGDKHLLGKPGIFINLEGKAEIVRDKEQFREHWNKSLDRWFEEGADTPGVVMIKVHARRVHYWEGMDEGEIEIR